MVASIQRQPSRTQFKPRKREVSFSHSLPSSDQISFQDFEDFDSTLDRSNSISSNPGSRRSSTISDSGRDRTDSLSSARCGRSPSFTSIRTSPAAARRGMRPRVRSERLHEAPEDFARSRALVQEESRRALNRNRVSRASRAGDSPLRSARLLAVQEVEEAEEKH